MNAPFPVGLRVAVSALSDVYRVKGVVNACDVTGYTYRVVIHTVFHTFIYLILAAFVILGSSIHNYMDYQWSCSYFVSLYEKVAALDFMLLYVLWLWLLWRRNLTQLLYG